MHYSKERLIYAHEDRKNPYYNHSYNRYVRDAICSECGQLIGEQLRYPDFNEDFRFVDEKAHYKHCPYCGHKFEFEHLENL